MSDPVRSGTTRRTLLNTIAGVSAASLVAPRAGVAADEPAKMRPQPGDVLVFAQGERKGQPIVAADLPLADDPVLAYPKDPVADLVRDGSRLNQLIVVRLDPAALSEETAEHAAEGVVAYSAICTHQNCPVSMWKSSNETLYCSCHGTQYDPRKNAEVVDGPAPRRLAALPLEIKDGMLVAAGELTGGVGSKKL
ncbi:MAG TPA: ubiquinol-cytochrome c reductase iron-sulfur subunit [Geminicoccaceae bacterium]